MLKIAKLKDMFKMILILASCFFSSFFANLFADDSIQFLYPNSPNIYAATSSQSLSLNVDTPKNGDAGRSSSDPYIAYLPVASSSGGVDNSEYFTASFLPEASTSYYLHFELTYNQATGSGTTKSLYVSVKGSDGNYKILSEETINTSSSSDNWAPTPTIGDICTNSGELSSCSSLSSTSAPSTADNTMLYFVIAEAGLSEIDPSETEQQNGIYVNLKISNKVYSSNEVVLDDLRKGDGQLTAVYSADFVMSELKSIYAFQYSDSFSLPPSDYKYSTVKNNGYLRDLEILTNSGEVKINELTNGKYYSFSIFFKDKYQFVTLGSNYRTERPLEIEALLESQACYLLTAGFEGEHPVVNYFRYIRDRYLNHSSLGKVFVAWYYRSAPAWAMTIYESNPLKLIIRSIAWIIYWNLKLFFAPLFLLLSLIFLTLKRRSLN